MTNQNGRICLIEDDEIIGEALSERLVLEGLACDWFRTGAEAILALGKQTYDVVVSDISLPDANGEDLFLALKAKGMELPPFIFVTAFGAIDAAVRLLKHGAEDYLTKPFDISHLLAKVKALACRSRESCRDALGVSQAMRHLEQTVARIAPTNRTVLVTGESGVGKEIVARRLHAVHAGATDAPFVAVNCGALTESLLEAQLFGYEKGAFTGALKTTKGYLEQAEGGTLFLDEIGDMPLAMQVKLLRVLQDRKVMRLGSEKPIDVNFRLICATHHDLRAMVEDGRFREDLYYRINVIHLRIPPLRERSDDILWLARRFLDEVASYPGEHPRSLHPAAELALLQHPWPGNVRELRHCIERASALTEATVIMPEWLFDLPSFEDQDIEHAPDLPPLNAFLDAREREHIIQALRINGWRIADTAATLGISRKNLWEKMKRLGIPKPESEAAAGTAV